MTAQLTTFLCIHLVNLHDRVYRGSSSNRYIHLHRTSDMRRRKAHLLRTSSRSRPSQRRPVQRALHHRSDVATPRRRHSQLRATHARHQQSADLHVRSSHRPRIRLGQRVQPQHRRLQRFSAHRNQFGSLCGHERTIPLCHLHTGHGEYGRVPGLQADRGILAVDPATDLSAVPGVL
jgi:hypothetical protein